MRVHFASDGWEDFVSWTRVQARTADIDVLEVIVRLIEDVRRSPFQGLGKPEPLRGDLARLWSRRITREHRLIYRVAGVAGQDQRVEVVACRGHY